MPVGLNLEEDTDVIFNYVSYFQYHTIEMEGQLIDISHYIPAPFEITLEILREIAEENDLLD